MFIPILKVGLLKIPLLVFLGNVCIHPYIEGRTAQYTFVGKPMYVSIPILKVGLLNIHLLVNLGMHPFLY